MPRPESVTEQDIARWDAEIAEYLKTPRNVIVASALKSLRGKEIWYAGAWLAERLQEAGASQELCHNICHAAGQRSALASDVWESCMSARERFLKGDWDVPGPELAEKLIKEAGLFDE